MSASRKKEKRDLLMAKATRRFRDTRGGANGKILLTDFVVKDAVKFKASITGFLSDEEIPIGYADCTDLVNSRLASMPEDSPERHHHLQELLYEFAMAQAALKFGEPQNMPFVFKIGREIYLLTFYDDQEKSPRLTNVLKLYSDKLELFGPELTYIATKIANLTEQINEGGQKIEALILLRDDVASKKKALPLEHNGETFKTLREIDIRIESLETFLEDTESKLRKEMKEEKQTREQLEIMSSGHALFLQLIDANEFPKSTSKVEDLISPPEMNIIIFKATGDHNILLFIPDYSYAVQPELVRRTLDRTIEFSKKQLGTSGTGMTLANIRAKISPLAAAMQGSPFLKEAHDIQQNKLKTRATQITLESAAECRDFATIAYAKLLENLPSNIRILMMSDGLHNFIIVGYEGEIPDGKLSLRDLDTQKDNIFLVDLWMSAMTGDTKSWGVYTLAEYRPKNVALRVTFDSHPTPADLKSFLTSSELRRDASGLDSPRSTLSTDSFSTFSGESVEEIPIPLSRRSIFSSVRSTTSIGSGSQRAPEEERYAPTSAQTTREFLTSSLGVPRSAAPRPSPPSDAEEERRTRTLGSRATAPTSRTQR